MKNAKCEVKMSLLLQKMNRNLYDLMCSENKSSLIQCSPVDPPHLSSIEMIHLESLNWVLEISQRKALQVANSTNLVSLFSENPCPWQRTVSDEILKQIL